MPKKDLVYVSSSSYNTEEIIEAKQIPHKYGESLNLDSMLPRLIKRAAGDNKRRLDSGYNVIAGGD